MSALESVFYDFLQSQYPAVASERIILVDTTSGNDNSEFWDIGQFEPIIDALNNAGAALIVPFEALPANTQLPDIERSQGKSTCKTANRIPGTTQTTRSDCGHRPRSR